MSQLASVARSPISTTRDRSVGTCKYKTTLDHSGQNIIASATWRRPPRMILRLSDLREKRVSKDIPFDNVEQN